LTSNLKGPNYSESDMAVINMRDKTLECKLVYYGPGRGGKTTNLEFIHRAGKKYTTSDMVSIKTKGDRTLYFDFLPIGIGKIKGYDVKVQLYTVPGQAKYNSTRKMVLKNVDGIVFVADSFEIRRKANILSLKNLQENLAEQEMNIFDIPMVIQFNKRDLADEGVPVMPLEQMEKELNCRLKAPTFEASALKGKGVGDSLKKCLILTLKKLQKEIKN
jgi:signal recognition particle receptor subunit beta